MPRKEIPVPVVIGIIAAVIIVVGLFFWKSYSATQSGVAGLSEHDQFAKMKEAHDKAIQSGQGLGVKPQTSASGASDPGGK